MSETFKRGEPVTVMPPYDNDPLILTFQNHGRIAKVCGQSGEAAYWVVLGTTWPTNRLFGPFPSSRLRSGWRDARGSWRATASK